MKIKTIQDLNKLKSAGAKLLKPKNIRIQVGSTAPYGLGKKAQAVLEKLRKEVAQQEVDATVASVGCIGMAHLEPIVDVIAPGTPKVTYGRVTTDQVPALVKTVAQGAVLKKLALYRTDAEDIIATGKTLRYADKTPKAYAKLPNRPARM